MKEAMTGTAGLTAGMYTKLTETVKPEDGIIVVSGATGGVGALSVSILKKLGYRVAAITGKETARDYLMNLELRLLSCEKILNPWIINRF
jgi:NADPH:quinone reductase-like Zn-dependent oxidoreductase